jgi:hypothetical protein
MSSFSAAVERMNTTPSPKVAEQFEDQIIMRLLCLIYCLHLGAGPEQTFYLSTRIGAKVLDGMDHNDVATFLRAFKALGIVQEVTKGTTKRSPRLLWLGDERPPPLSQAGPLINDTTFGLR